MDERATRRESDRVDGHSPPRDRRRRADPPPTHAAGLLELQGRAGNKAVAELLARADQVQVPGILPRGRAGAAAHDVPRGASPTSGGTPVQRQGSDDEELPAGRTRKRAAKAKRERRHEAPGTGRPRSTRRGRGHEPRGKHERGRSGALAKQMAEPSSDVEGRRSRSTTDPVVSEFHVLAVRESKAVDSDSDSGSDSGSDSDSEVVFEETEEQVGWRIQIRVRFADASPRRWGEFRAYGGLLMKTDGQTTIHFGKTLRDVRKADRKARSRLDRGDTYNRTRPVPTATTAVAWDDDDGPVRDAAGEVLFLENDQHMDVFYQQVVPFVPRSEPAKAPESGENREMAMAPYFGDLETPNDFDDLDDELRSAVEDLLPDNNVVVFDQPEASVPRDAPFEYTHHAVYDIVDRDATVLYRHRLTLKLFRRNHRGPIEESVQEHPESID